MDTHTYNDALLAMKGLEPEHVTYLRELGNQLTPEQRSQAIDALKKKSEQVVKAGEKLIKIYDDAVEEVAKMSHKAVPEIRRAKEKVEQDADMQHAEADMQSITPPAL